MNVEHLVKCSRELLQIDLTGEMQRAFSIYADELLAWNAHTNLTAITAPEAIETRHFLDSLTVSRAIPLAAQKRIIDVGTGAGFPGLPLRIVYPHLELTLLEATAKKTHFLTHITETLRLSGVRIATARAEEAGQQSGMREQFDVVLARAVAQMPTLMEYLLPLCRVGGVCIALKGESAAAEAQQADNALRILGGHLERVIAVELPQVVETHHLVVVKKTAATPPNYPRRPGIPAKRPL